MSTRADTDAAGPGRFRVAVRGRPIGHQGDRVVMLPGPSCIGEAPDRPPVWPDDGREQFHLGLAADDLKRAAAGRADHGATSPAMPPGETRIVCLDHSIWVTDAKVWS